MIALHMLSRNGKKLWANIQYRNHLRSRSIFMIAPPQTENSLTLIYAKNPGILRKNIISI